MSKDMMWGSAFPFPSIAFPGVPNVPLQPVISLPLLTLLVPPNVPPLSVCYFLVLLFSELSGSTAVRVTIWNLSYQFSLRLSW